LAYAGWQFVASEKEYNTVLFGSFKAWYLEIIIPIGFFMIGLRLLLQFIELVLGKEPVNCRELSL